MSQVFSVFEKMADVVMVDCSEKWLTKRHREENAVFYTQFHLPTLDVDIKTSEEGFRFLVNVTELHLQRLEDNPDILNPSNPKGSFKSVHTIIASYTNQITQFVVDDYIHGKLSEAVYCCAMLTISNYATVLERLYYAYDESQAAELVTFLRASNMDFRSIHWIILVEQKIRMLAAKPIRS